MEAETQRVRGAFGINPIIRSTFLRDTHTHAPAAHAHTRMYKILLELQQRVLVPHLHIFIDTLMLFVHRAAFLTDFSRI